MRATVSDTEHTIDSKRHGRAYPMSLEKHHDILHAPLFLPGLHDAPRPNLADAIDLQDAQRLLRQNSQGVETEGRHQPFRVSGTDAFDQTGTEIFFDSFDGRRINFLPMVDLKLKSVAWVRLSKTR